MKVVKVYITSPVRKLVGELRDKDFHKRVSRKLHLYRDLNAWGMDGKVFDDFVTKNAERIIIFDKDTKKYYIADVQTFKTNGVRLHHKPHREQIFLTLKHFQVYDNAKDFRHRD